MVGVEVEYPLICPMAMVTPGLPALPGRKERLLYPGIEDEEREVRRNELRGDPGGE